MTEALSAKLRGVESRVKAHLARINRPAPEFIFARTAQQDGSPHVEILDDGFAWVHSERGNETARKLVSADDLLYLALEALTQDYAQQAEMQSRGARPYCRWCWMEAHIRMMAHFDLVWGARLSERYEHLLESQPLTAEEIRSAMQPLDLTHFGID